MRLASILIAAVSLASGTADPLAAILAGFERSSAPALTSYEATRLLSVSTRGGKMQATLRARTTLSPEGGFQYEVLDADGSPMLQRKVLRAALEAERTMALRGDGRRGALSADNYAFGADDDTGSPLLRLTLTPRRSDALLVRGAMYVTRDDYDLVRVEGLLVKRPSFWTRRVHVSRQYGRIAGVRVPLAMESTASVLIVGTSRFAMTYEYSSVNGIAAGTLPPNPAGS